jgi:hypothetical protein
MRMDSKVEAQRVTHVWSLADLLGRWSPCFSRSFGLRLVASRGDNCHHPCDWNAWSFRSRLEWLSLEIYRFSVCWLSTIWLAMLYIYTWWWLLITYTIIIMQCNVLYFYGYMGIRYVICVNTSLLKGGLAPSRMDYLWYLDAWDEDGRESSEYWKHLKQHNAMKDMDN